ncbi:alpha-amylase family protein [Paenibacillus larvae]|uniref:alpha-amylase family protein n=1 Tax=Paenibacillus larvae TaxID=1464 RepID=UPI001F37CD64|nr:alpha-amylase family protein [Paenibacillus larvae]
MDAHIYPLVKGISKEGREVAAPVVLLENTKGAFAGSRWIFVNQALTEAFWEEKGAQAVMEWAAFCARGVTEMWLKPHFAVYDPGDKPKVKFQLQGLSRFCQANDRNDKWSFTFTFGKQGEAPFWTYQFEMDNSRELDFEHIRIPVQVESGQYDMTLKAESDRGEVRYLRQGIWGMDEQLLRGGEYLTCDRDYFRKNGRPLPIIGMTYMTSDVARKFMFLPNVSVWDKDMAAMKKAGINMIRTGFWTSYRHISYMDGHPSEGVLRAIDAFILTAKKHDIEVCFNFFAFTPEMWEGSNPYLDPRSVEAQKRFIAAFVSRHKETKNLHWDLINEPSMFDHKREFLGPRSCQDPYEKAAYIEWLKRRHQGDIRKVQEAWGLTPDQLPDFDSVILPEPEEINFDIQDMLFGKKGSCWLDYSLFTMDMLNRWAEQLNETIRSIQPKQLITIGQDEALGAQRPSPFFYEQAMDYTTNHSWWLMDQLVWDGIFAKTPNKPNLIQETGIMYVETPDGRAKRSEIELRNILERKYAYSFSTGGAGAVQWLWNTNFYMDNINESNIGALRADGTEKPEANVSYDFGRFMEACRDLFEDRKLEDVVVVFPYSNDLSNRSFAVEATSRLTRVLAHEMNVHFRAMGEYQLDALKDQPAKLIVLPSAHNLSESAFAKLAEHIRQHGGTLLVTGPLGLTEYWQPAKRLQDALGERILANVLREEAIEVGGRVVPLAYGRRKIAKLNKEVAVDPATGLASKQIAQLHEVQLGQGRLLWCGLPVEMNDREEALHVLYSHVLEQCRVEPELTWHKGGGLAGIYGRKLSFHKGALYIFVSEYAYNADIMVQDPATGRTYEFVLETERSVMFATDLTGKVQQVYRPDEVSIIFG